MKKPVTPRGVARLRAELKELKAMRPELANAIEVARAMGDLSENADYDAAKEKSGMTEAKIRDIESQLSMAEVVDPSSLKDPQKVVFGVTVDIEDLDTGETKTLSIYGSSESNIEKGWISFESPLARGLIGKAVGDVALLSLPGGNKEYEIVDIRVEYSADDV